MPEFLEYWRAIMLHKWSILALASCVGAFTYAVVSQMPPIYRSSATVLVETDTPKLVSVGETYSRDGSYYHYREHFQTQIEVLKSREVAKRVVAKLNLAEHPEFDPRQRKPSAIQQWTSKHLPSLAAWYWKPGAPLNEASVTESVLGQFAGSLSIQPVRQSQLIKVSFQSHDPRLAAAAANATAEAYVQADLDARYKTTERGGELINQQLAELKSKLDASDMALQDYRERAGLLDSKSTVLGGAGKQLDELTQRLVDARVRRFEAEQAYRQVRTAERNDYDSMPAVIKSHSIQRAKQDEAEAERKVAEASERYGSDHPTLVAANISLKAARTNTQREIQNLMASVTKEYKVALATEKTVEEALARSKEAIQNLNRKEIQLGVLEREANTNRELYQAFLSRSRETSATKAAQASNARLVDPAVPALSPIAPKKSLLVGSAAMMSLLLGVAGSLFLKVVRNTVKTSADVEAKLHQPFLAAVPTLPRKHKKNFDGKTLNRPNSHFVESIRTASIGVVLSALDIPRKVVVVTSSAPEEGKSTFAINLAFSLAKAKRVVLIEADMRRPCFAKVFDVPRERKGLSQLIAGGCTVDECLDKINGTDLHIISAGLVPPNPLDLFLSQRFRDVLTVLRERYDMVIIDTPPVRLFSDALVIGTVSTGLIYVVKADETSVPVARAGLNRITSANIPIIGVVLNQQDFKKAEKFHGEYSRYAKYGYGPGYDAHTRGSRLRKNKSPLRNIPMPDQPQHADGTENQRPVL
jgi:capsular exopolysaccharide synthesis family protein